VERKKKTEGRHWIEERKQRKTKGKNEALPN
jgi:hypothetical protein